MKSFLSNRFPVLIAFGLAWSPGVLLAEEWSYAGATGPERWGTLRPEFRACAEGRSQSPVNIETNRVKANPGTEVRLRLDQADAELHAGGHGLQLSLSGGELNALANRFASAQFHFHTPSENRLNGRAFPAEIHFVNRDTNGRLAVLGVFVEEGPASSVFAKILSEENEAKQPGGPGLDPAALFPQNAGVYSYRGSLTTPPCTEGVLWLVLDRPVSFSREQIETLVGRIGASARPVQALNGREIARLEGGFTLEATAGDAGAGQESTSNRTTEVERESTDRSGGIMFWIIVFTGTVLVLLVLLLSVRIGQRLLDRFSLVAKVVALAVALLLSTATIAVFSLYYIGEIGTEIAEIAEEDIPLSRAITRIATGQLLIGLSFQRGVILTVKGDLAGQQRQKAAFQKFNAEMEKDFDEFEKIARNGIEKSDSAEARHEFESSLARIKKIETDSAKFRADAGRIFPLLEAGSLEQARIIVSDLETAQERLDQDLMEMGQEIRKFTQESAEAAETHDKEAIRNILAICLFSILIGVIFSLAAIRNILRTLGADPGVLRGISEVLAEGDLAEMDRRRDARAVGVLASLLEMSHRLGEIIRSVNANARTLLQAAEQVSSTAQSMSQDASEQAASVEETSSSLEEMTATIRNNADNARNTEAIATKSAEQAREGGEAVRNTVSAMNRIAEKIGIIEDIAYKTNLLALNAAIEAARAGEHGKGFAVVANEVRKLAERSQDAAGEISGMARDSVDIAHRAGGLIEEVVTSIRKTADLVREISAASEEQKTGAEQINVAIRQLDEVTQKNASAAEELASTSEELNSQARSLQDVMSFFKIEVESASPHTTPPPVTRPAPGSVRPAPAIRQSDFERF